MMSDVKERMLPLMVEYLALVVLGRLRDADKIVAYKVDNYENELIVRFTIDGQNWVRVEINVIEVLDFDDVDKAMQRVLDSTNKIQTQLTAAVIRRRGNAQGHIKDTS